LDSLWGLGTALQYAIDFYSSASPFGLFHPQPVDPTAQNTVLQTLPPPMPDCVAALAEGVDGDGLLTKEELLVAIASAQRGSAPGNDGLPYEVYRHFKSALLPLLLLVFNRSFSSMASPSPASSTFEALLRGGICPIPKPSQPRDEMAGYRPITLLNCDLKLVMLVLANRLQRPLDYIIDITQSAFLRGRDITDNVRYHMGLRARFQELGTPGWLLHSDLTKAYDSVNRPSLLRAMKQLGLRQTGIIPWISLLFEGTSASVRLNGHFSTPFAITDMSLQQGGSLSCPLWDIAGEEKKKKKKRGLHLLPL